MAEKSIYDEHGNYLGYDVTMVDKDGRTHVSHYDKNGNYIGETYETTDWRGNEYITHKDENGKSIAHSEMVRDFWGAYHLNTTETHYGREKREKFQDILKNEKSDDDSDSGIIGALFATIFSLLGAVILLGLKVLSVFFLYVWLPMFAAATLVSWSSIIIFAATGLHPVAIFFAVICSIMQFVAIPYWVILYRQKFKKHLTWKETLKYHWKWFLIGPFAYPHVIKLTKTK